MAPPPPQPHIPTPGQCPFIPSPLHTDGTSCHVGVCTDSEPHVNHGVQKRRTLTLISHTLWGHPSGPAPSAWDGDWCEDTRDPVRPLLMGRVLKRHGCNQPVHPQHASLELSLATCPALQPESEGRLPSLRAPGSSEPLQELEPSQQMLILDSLSFL